MGFGVAAEHGFGRAIVRLRASSLLSWSDYPLSSPNTKSPYRIWSEQSEARSHHPGYQKRERSRSPPEPPAIEGNQAFIKSLHQVFIKRTRGIPKCNQMRPSTLISSTPHDEAHSSHPLLMMNHLIPKRAVVAYLLQSPASDRRPDGRDVRRRHQPKREGEHVRHH